ncbi:FapA family protein [Cytobacillus sp. S13-E01]|uniref:DUF342 domain-containing protein n=1 Tax=Cytobacillus sp. S13-E01 TaxID=3031326 RepID=UPI0023D7E5CA|nr:FapA family protein [Cytobacillus sp. S13-E01]MDF0725161.1 FapA family protein [Cytobacillus sp. S13-E01]
MNDLFDLSVSNDSLQAYLKIKENTSVSTDSLSDIVIQDYLKEKGISFGIKGETIKKMVENQASWYIENLVAEGIAPFKGKDGYLKHERSESTENRSGNEELNLRNVITIPSVSSGQLIAKVIQPSKAREGVNVYGKALFASDGKPYKLRLGKNTVEKEGSIYSTIDGQISFSGNKVNVLPVYEVSGDLDMKTGNINFIGTVIVRGDVPPGYTIQAGGDIKIYGMVEGADLFAGGSIYISGGIAGSNRGKIVTSGNLTASYINQGHVQAGHNIEVTTTILHSYCQAQRQISCQKGTIIGGICSAGSSITAKDFGNELHTKTEVHIGVNQQAFEKEKFLTEQLVHVQEENAKLQLLAKKLAEKYKSTGSLSTQEVTLLKRQKVTEAKINKQELEIFEELQEIQRVIGELEKSYILVNGSIKPNVHIICGKYKRIINQAHKAVKIQLINKEIKIGSV